MIITLLILMKPVFIREWKHNYSWLPKGINSQILNLNITGRWCIIADVWLDGQFLCIIVHWTVNSNNFQQYLSILRYSLKYISYFIEKYINERIVTLINIFLIYIININQILLALSYYTTLKLGLIIEFKKIT